MPFQSPTSSPINQGDTVRCIDAGVAEGHRQLLTQGATYTVNYVLRAGATHEFNSSEGDFPFGPFTSDVVFLAPFKKPNGRTIKNLYPFDANRFVAVTTSARV